MNDLNRLLDDAVPEPRRALSAGDLVRRARRRRTTRTAALGAVTASAVVAGVAVAGAMTRAPGTLRPPVASPGSAAPSPSPSIHGSPGTPGDWPPSQMFTDPFCGRRHPEELRTFPNAFDATVTAVRHHGPGRSVEIDLVVHYVYDGPARKEVTLTSPPEVVPDERITGQRVLAAVLDDLTVTPCGYTRPWDGALANAWQHAYEKPDDCGLWDLRLHHPGFDAPEFEGLSVTEAADLAERRGLSVRYAGDAAPGAHTDDLRDDRVNLCDRDGRVTAAVRG